MLLLDVPSKQSTMPARIDVVNAMSVDVEDYYQVSAFAGVVSRAHWGSYPSRVEDNTRRILDLFDAFGVRATFFVLGCVAQRHPRLVRMIVAAGHEIGSHGYAHYRVFEQTPPSFRADVERTRLILEDIAGTEVLGYRAASFSILRRTWWAFEMLAEAGYRYSSSVNPIRHDHYGVPDGPRHAFSPHRGLVEIPISTVELLGQRLPCGGGGFFRLLPYQWSRWAIGRLNASERSPAVFYFHPWEIDPDQPRIADTPARARFRHYTNLSRMQGKLERLLRDFRWGRLRDVFPEIVTGAAP